MGTLPSIGFTELIILIMLLVASMTVMLFTLMYFLRKRQSKAVKFEAVHITELIKLIISVGSFVTVCVTLVFLVLQNRIIVMQTQYASQSVESNVFSTVTGQNLATDELFIKFPELRPYFFQGRDLSDGDPLSERLQAAAEYLLDNYDSQSTQLKKYPNLWRSEKGAWEANIIDMFAWSPMLCRYLEANKDWYGEDLVSLKKAGEQKRVRGARQQILPPLKPTAP